MVGLAAGIGLLGLGTDKAAAQTPLQDAARNPQQSSMAANIVPLCMELAGLGGDNAPGDQGDLFRVCNGAILSANGGRADEAATALGQIAAEELIAQEAVINGTIAPQTRALAARISVLGGRIGTAQLARKGHDRIAEGTQLASAGDWQVAADETASTMSAEHFRGIGVFLTGSYSFGDKDQTSLEAGFDFDDYAVTAGIDYFVVDNLAVGLAFGYAISDVEFDANAGEIDAEGYNVAVYSVWNPTDQLGFSGYLSYGMSNFESVRNVNYVDARGAINRVITGDTDADLFEATGNVYYDFVSGPWTYGPTGRLSFRHTDIDGFSENGGQGLDLTFQDQDAQSLQTALGAAAGYALSTASGVLQLQARAEWIHEFLDDSRVISLRYENDPTGNSPVITLTTDDPDRDRFLVAGGASFVFADGVSAFADFETVLGHEDVNNHTITAGVRLEL